MNPKRITILSAVLAAALLGGCVMRPTESAAPETPSRLPEASAAPELARHRVEFWQGDTLLSTQTVENGVSPQVPSVADARLLGWTDEQGRRVQPSAPVYADAVYRADTRPLLVQTTAWLSPRENGFLAPEDAFTRADALAALRVWLGEDAAPLPVTDGWDADENALAEPLRPEEFTALLYALFDTNEADRVLAEAFPSPEDTVNRARAAYCVTRLAGATTTDEFYFPDAAPDRWAWDELRIAAQPGTLDREALLSETLDGFLWLDGYLYRLDDTGYFLADQEYDGLYYGPDGRYTSGSAELDDYVAQTIVQYTLPSQDRLERLHALYYHVKNDFKYLVRNYYDSGAHGWEINEALTLYETGRGNCYCYTGMFWSLARGMGYNATAYSGTMGNQNQPHAWTEITLDGEVYICDPEIEMNYWWLASLNGDNSMYTNNFMMRRSAAGGWNYQAVGRQ